MSHRVVWTEVAVSDLEAIVDFVSERDGPAHAVRVLDLIEPKVDSLRTHPTRCRVVPELARIGVRVYRELLAGPYRIPFRIRGKTLVLLGVLDGRRDLEELLIERATRP